MSEAKVSPESIELRAPPRPVTRLNRRSLAVAVGMVAAALLGATLWSLQAGRKGKRDPAAELHNVDRIAHAEAVDQLPADYSKMIPPAKPAVPPAPLLGDPLPGDLGGPLLEAQRRSGQGSAGTVPAGNASATTAQNEQVNRQREAEEAAKAPIFFKSAGKTPLNAASAGGEPTEQSSTRSNVSGAKETSVGAEGTRSARVDDHKSSFLARGVETLARSMQRVQPPDSAYQVMAGTIIPAALLTGINSDLPGKVLASVTEPVYDSATGIHLLIPQGSRLIGQYDSQIAAGQQRVLLVWTRLIFPDTSSISLERLQGLDPSGYAGLRDGVDRHWRQLLAGAALSTLIGVGAELAAPNRASGPNEIVVSTGRSIQDTANQVGQELTRRNMNLQPTLTIRPGALVRVMVDKDLTLPSYKLNPANRITE